MPVTIVVSSLLWSIAITFVPGLFVVFALKIPRLLKLSVAPALTMFLTWLTGLTASGVGAPWNAWWLVIAGFILGICTYAITRWISPDAESITHLPPRIAGAVIAAIVAAAVFGMSIYLTVSAMMSVVPQDFDATFHSNAIRWIADVGDASAMGLSLLNNFNEPGGLYYPNVFHALASTSMSAVGFDTLPALHSAVCVWFLILPLGAASLARAFRLGATGMSAAAFASVLFTSLPYELIWRGLYPFGLAIVLIPGLLAWLVFSLETPRALEAILVAAGTVGTIMTHMSAAPTLLVVGGSLVVWLLIQQRTQWRALTRWLLLATATLVLALIPVALQMPATMSSTIASTDWPAVQSVEAALGSALFFGTGFRDTVQSFVALLVWTGVGACALSRYKRVLAILPSLLTAMALYVVAAAMDTPFSTKITSFWWNDQLRLASLPPLLAPLFIGVLAQTLMEEYAPTLANLRKAKAIGLSHVIAVLLGLAVFASGAFFVRITWAQNHNAVAYMYRETDGVSHAEQRAYQKLAQTVPVECRTPQPRPPCRVMNDYTDGSSWIYALTGVHTLSAHAMPSSGASRLTQSFNQLATNPDVRALARNNAIAYVFIGKGFTNPYAERPAGMNDLESHPEAFEQLWKEDGGTLYRVRWENLPA